MNVVAVASVVFFGGGSVALLVGLWMGRQEDRRRNRAEVEGRLALRKVELRVAAARERHARSEARAAEWRRERQQKIEAIERDETRLIVCPVDGCESHLVRRITRSNPAAAYRCTEHGESFIDTGIRSWQVPCGGAR